MVPGIPLTWDTFLDFVTAIGLGGLIGLEREHGGEDTVIMAGVRTFPLFCLCGYMVGLLGTATAQPLIVAAGIGIATATAITFAWIRHRLGTHGFTTPMAILVTFLLGMIIPYGYREIAVVIGVATTFLLVTKGTLHAFAGALRDDEIVSVLEFVTVVFILFPIASSVSGPILGVPWLGRGRLVDPYEILLIVILVSSISFVSFLAMRFIGPSRGIEVSGLLGGLVNSEAATISLASRARDSNALGPVAEVGILAALSTMFLRGAAIVALSGGATATAILWAIAPVVLVGVLGAALAAVLLGSRISRKDIDKVQPQVRNPFALGQALRFALVFAVVSVIVTLLSEAFGPRGVYITAIGGLVNAGAVLASLASLAATGTIDIRAAGVACSLTLIAAVANKLVILRQTNRPLFERSALPLAVVLLLSAIAFGGGLLFPLPR